jgi:TetR/AcrR family transcriptional repressor of nem operon
MAKITAREKILQAAQELMMAHGYSATSVDDIVKKAGVAKGSFYHAFKSKEELALAALEDYEVRGWELISQGSYIDESDPVKRILKFLDFIEEKAPEFWGHGCLIGSVAIEVYTSYPKLINRIDELFEEFENNVASIFEPGLKAAGVTEVTAKELSIHFLAVIEGAIITARSHKATQYLVDGMRHFRRYVEYLLKQ